MPSELVFAFGTYVGEVEPSLGLRHGRGSLRYNNGNVYDGQWVMGAATGTGRKVWANGDVYVGSFLSGKKHGQGRYTFSNGAFYDGHYTEDVPEGEGVQTMPNGDVYKGDWHNGRRHGKGVEALHNGKVFEGSFDLGRRWGHGTLRSEGEIITGMWDGDRCLEVIHREFPNESADRGTEPPPTQSSPLPMGEMLSEMEAAGLDPALLAQIANFNVNVFGQMERVMGGLGSLGAQLEDLQGCLEDLEGVDRDTS